MDTLVIRTSDNQEIQVDTRITNLSVHLKNISESGSDIIPVNVSSEIFSKVVEFCIINDYQPIKIEKPLKSRVLQENLKEKDYNFIKSYTLGTIKPLVDAAYYLGLESLRDVCLCLIATDFYIGDSVEDIEKIKEKFGINADMTAEEEDEIKKDYPWAAEEEIAEGKIEASNELIIEESKD